MPGNEVEDGIHNLFEVDNSSQWQYLSHAVDGGWSVINDNQWAGEQRQSVVPLNFNQNRYSLQELDSLRGHGGESISVSYTPNYVTLTPRPENNRSHSRNYECNTNGSLPGNQSFQTRLSQSGFLGEYTSYDQHNLTLRGLSILKSQQEYESGTDSPTLTANSERSEITEVSTDFNILRGQQQFASGQQPGILQPGQMQQSGYNDMQLLQQHMMFKQLQEFQKQQQLQQLGDVRQQNSVNQLSAMSKQAAGGQFSPLNGTPINDASQMFMNWVQCGASSAAQEVANRLMFSPEQGQPLRSMGLVPQPLDVSLFGTPVGSARGNIGQFSHVPGISQAHKSVAQSSVLSNPFLRDQFSVSPDQVSIPQGAFITSQGISGKSVFGQVPNQGLNSGISSENLQERNSLQTNASGKEFNGRQEQTGWSVMQHKTTQQGLSQGLVPLDPMEEKILYNMDDNIWDSFGKRPDMGAVGFGNTLENTDLSNSFPSLQSGSWSALMQSAVAEASSSDTGLQEEWSGLTFQNTEPSNDNQLSNFMESDNQQTGWVDNNLQSASSFSSKPLYVLSDSSMSSSFPGFQQSGIQFAVEHREVMRQDGSHESIDKSPKVTGEWMDCSPQMKPSTEGNQQVQSFMHLNNAWAGQMYQQAEGNTDQQKMASHREDSQLNFAAAPNNFVKAHQITSPRVSENNQSDYLGNHNISVDKNEKENMGKSSQQISNGSRILSNVYDGESETYEKRDSYFQRQSSMGSYNSKGLTGGEQGLSGQLQFFGNSSGNATNMEQARLSHFQGNSRVSEEVPSGDDFKAGGSDGSNVTSQPSQNMLQLLQKVDQSRDDVSGKHIGSADSNSLARVTEAEMSTPGTQLYNQSSASQGFGLRLAPPSQRLPNSSNFLSSQGSPLTRSYPDSRQVNLELKDKNLTWVGSPSSTQTVPPSHEMSQRAYWDNKASALGHTGNSSYLNIQGNSVASYSPSSLYARNQSQMQVLSSGPLVSQSLQATLTSTASRYPPFDHAASQDSPQQISSNPLDQQFPVFEAVPVSQPSVISATSQQGEVSARQHNVWRNVPIQRQPSVPEPPKVLSNLSSAMDPSNVNMMNAPKVGHISDLGARLQQQLPSEILDTSQTAGLLHGPKPFSKHNSDANDLPSGSLVTNSNQQDLYGIKNDYNNSPTACQRNLASVVHSLESSPDQSYSLLDQVQAMKVVQADPSKRMGQLMHEHNFRSGNPMDSGRISGELNSDSSRDTKTMTFLMESTEDPSTKSLARPAFPEQTTSAMVKFGQSDFHSQSGSSNLISNTLEQNQVNLHMAPSWFKQYGTLKNGQMLPMYDDRLAKVASAQFFPGKTSQNLHSRASLDGVDATDARQGGTVLPSTIPNLVGTEHFSAPYVLPSDVINPSMAVTKPRKRKRVTLELLPWHKEVMGGSEGLQNMGMAEEDWAQATKRLTEKVEDEVEIEDLQPMLRTKRRLILTAQLMQQLFRPAPASILSADVASYYNTVTYFASKLALGDACSLTCHRRNDLLLPKNNCNMISEKLRTSEGTVSQQILQVVEKLTARAKKLENDFQSMVKATSIVDIKVECQELERFAVINRFAKFHIRGQADASGTSSSGQQRPLPQRYVTVVPMPRNLPEGLQCISL